MAYITNIDHNSEAENSKIKASTDSGSSEAVKTLSGL